MAATNLRRIGTQTNGKAANVDFRVVNAVKLAFALIKLATGYDLYSRIIQAQGGARLSAGTHADGFCLDIRVWGWSRKTINVIVAIFRECGFSASWYRDWTGNAHLHIASDMWAVWTKAQYQATAVRAGYNGLGKGGRGGRDPHAKPTEWRKADTTGPAWAVKQLNPGLPGTGADPEIKPPIPPKEDTLSKAEVDAINAYTTATANELKAYIRDTVANLDGANIKRSSSVIARLEAMPGTINAYTRDTSANQFAAIQADFAKLSAGTHAGGNVVDAVNKHVSDTVQALQESMLRDNDELAKIVASKVWTTAINWGSAEKPDYMAALKVLADAHSFSRQSLALDLAAAEARRQAQHGPVDYGKVAAVVAAELKKLTLTTGGTK